MEKFIPGKLYSGTKGYERGKPGKTPEELKDLLIQAWNTEVVEREEGLGRSLSTEEKGEIKITQELINRWHKRGLIPGLYSLRHHFGSLANLANLLGLSAYSIRPIEIYDEGERGTYLEILKAYVKKFQEDNKRDITRTELRKALRGGKITGVPTTIFNHLDVFNILGIEPRKPGIKKYTFSEADLIEAVRRVFEKKCQEEAQKLGKDSLTPEEKKKVKLKIRDYRSFKEEDEPHDAILVKRLGKKFGPSWDEVLEKAGLPHN